MNIAVLVFIMIVIALAMFFLGVIVAGWRVSNKCAEATIMAIDESDMTIEQKLELITKIRMNIKKV